MSEQEQEHLYTVEGGHVYTLISGRWKVECLPYLDDMMRAGSALVLPDAPEIPTYTMVDADGDESVPVPYNQAAIDDPDTPDEDKAKWTEYLEKLAVHKIEVAKITNQKNLMTVRVWAYRALRFPCLDEWAKEREEFYGIPVSEDERERKMEFAVNEIGREQLNAIRIAAGCAKAQGANQEALDQVEAMFRNQMGQADGQDAQTDPPTTPTGEQEEAEGLVDGDTVDVA